MELGDRLRSVYILFFNPFYMLVALSFPFDLVFVDRVSRSTDETPPMGNDAFNFPLVNVFLDRARRLLRALERIRLWALSELLDGDHGMNSLGVREVKFIRHFTDPL